MKRTTFWIPLSSALGGALLLWALWGLVGVQLVASYWTAIRQVFPLAASISDLGQTGDLFGGINALFAAFAFAGVALAAFYQYETWKLQAEETQLARTEHAQQSFEPLFFKLLERLEAVSQPAREIFTSRWVYVVEEAYRLYRTTGAENQTTMHRMPPTLLQTYTEMYEQHQLTLGPYFRSLYHIFKFISNSNLRADEKVLYANIARATLNEAEVAMLGFNCLSGEGRDFIRYVEAYGLLKHVMNNDARELFNSYYAHTASMSSRRRSEYWMERKSEYPPFLNQTAREAE
jgi:hypothetical protein